MHEWDSLSPKCLVLLRMAVKSSVGPLWCVQWAFFSWLNQLIFSFTLFTREDDRCQFVNPLTHKKRAANSSLLLFILNFFPPKKSFKLFYFSTEQKHIYEDGYTKSILYWWCFYWFDNKTNTSHNHTRSMLIRLISLFFHLRLYVFLLFSRGTRKYSHTGFGPREAISFSYMNLKLLRIHEHSPFTVFPLTSSLFYCISIASSSAFFSISFFFFLLTTWSEQHTKHSVFFSSLLFTSLSELFWACTFKSINVWCYFTEARRRRMCRYAKVRRSPELFFFFFCRLARVYTILRGGQFIFSRECRAACAKTTCTASVFQTVTELIVWRFE